MKRILFMLSILCIGLLHISCGLFHKPAPKYIFFLTLDTTRADHVDYEINQKKYTPNLTALAQTGTYFKRAYSLIPITLPSHLSMFYSLHPNALKVYNNGGTLKTAHPSLAQLLNAGGYQTAAVVSLGVLGSQFGVCRGYQKFIEGFNTLRWYKTAEEVNKQIIPVIDSHKGNPAFFWIHYSDPHEPYFIPGMGGTITAFLDEQSMFQAPLTEFPTFKLKFRIKPGRHILSMRADVPSHFQRKRMSIINKFLFTRLSIEAAQAKQDLEIQFPDHWNQVISKVEGRNNFSTREKISDIVLVNKGKNDLEINARFYFKTRIDYMFIKHLYRMEVTYMDKQIGKLIEHVKKLGIFDQSAFVIIGDHGEGLGEYRGHVGHIHYLNKVFTHVPLILCGQGFNKEGSRDDLVSPLNIAPTILELAGLKKPSFMTGESLFKRTTSNKLLLETYSPEAYFDSFSLIDYPYQIIFQPGQIDDKIEYYNLEQDDYGAIPLPPEQVPAQIKNHLFDSILKISRKLTAAKSKMRDVSNETKEMLETLGYL